MDTSAELTQLATLPEIQFDSQSLPSEVVIQEIPSRLYVSESDFLTEDIENARKFDSCKAALEETAHLKLHSVQLVVNGESSEWELLRVGTAVLM